MSSTTPGDLGAAGIPADGGVGRAEASSRAETPSGAPNRSSPGEASAETYGLDSGMTASALQAGRSRGISAGRYSAGRYSAGTISAAGPQPVFWKELYWFALIALGAWTASVWLLAPLLARGRETRDLEHRLERNLRTLTELERQYEAAIAAMENDPYYRESVYRVLLGVKKANEVFLKSPTPDGR